MEYGEVEKYIGKYLYHKFVGKVKVIRRTERPFFVVKDVKLGLTYGKMHPMFLGEDKGYEKVNL
jgi:hypothetical protein